jgi:hypothetical protein
MDTPHTIKRLKKDEMKDEILPEVPVQRYRGPQKPDMPANMASRSPLPLKVHQSLMVTI